MGEIPRRINVQQFHLKEIEAEPDLARAHNSHKYKTMYPKRILTLSSVTFNTNFLFGTYTSPFRDNSGFWDGSCKVQHKIEVRVYIGWIENEMQFEHYHYTTAYIRRAARAFFKSLLQYHMDYAKHRYWTSLGKEGFFKTTVSFCRSGTGRKHCKQPQSKYESIFFHQPRSSPQVIIENWPRKSNIPNLDTSSALWKDYVRLELSK